MKRPAVLLLLLLLLLLVPALSACGGPPAAEPRDMIECAVGGASGFERVCTVERSPGPEVVFTLRSPNGGFRRIVATRDGRGVVASDGAEPAKVEVIGKDLILVSIGSDRYRLPARVR